MTNEQKKIRLLVAAVCVGLVLIIVLLVRAQKPHYDQQAVTAYRGVSSGRVFAALDSDQAHVSVFNGRTVSRLSLADGTTSALSRDLAMPTIDQLCWAADRSFVVFSAKNYSNQDELAPILVQKDQSLQDTYWWSLNVVSGEATLLGPGFRSCFMGAISKKIYLTTDALADDEGTASSGNLGVIKSKVVIFDPATFKRKLDFYVPGVVSMLRESSDSQLALFNTRIKPTDGDPEGSATLTVNSTSGSESLRHNWKDDQVISNNGSFGARIDSTAKGGTEGEGELPGNLKISSLKSNKDLYSLGNIGLHSVGGWTAKNEYLVYGTDFSSKDRTSMLVKVNPETKKAVRLVPRNGSGKDEKLSEIKPVSLQSGDGSLVLVSYVEGFDILSTTPIKPVPGIADKLSKLKVSADQPFSLSYNAGTGVLSVSYYDDSADTKSKLKQFLKDGGIDENLVEIKASYDASVFSDPIPELIPGF